MNDEQRRVALFQAQPDGLGLFFHPAALSFAHVASLHVALSALPGKKRAPAALIGLVLTGPSNRSQYRSGQRNRSGSVDLNLVIRRLAMSGRSHRLTGQMNSRAAFAVAPARDEAYTDHSNLSGLPQSVKGIRAASLPCRKRL